MSEFKDELKYMKNRAIWYVKQLLPLTYYTEYLEGNKKYVEIWKMYMGHIYKDHKWEVK